MAAYTDQMGRKVDLPRVPSRIVSLVPSQTELLFYFGLNNYITAVTQFCIHPADDVMQKTKIGGTKKLDIPKILDLKPDLIIGNKEENQKAQILELAAKHPVWMSDVSNLQDGLDMINDLAEIFDKKKAGQQLAGQIQSGFQNFEQNLQNSRLTKVAYIIWRDPIMTVGSGTFINSMLETCGLENVFAGKGKYPQLSPEELEHASPELIFLSSEPFPFKDKHIEEFSEICPSAMVVPVNGEAFSWYGNRLLDSPAYFQELLLNI